MQESNFWLGGWTHVRAVGRAPSDKGFFWKHWLLLGKGAEWEEDKKKWKEVPSAKCYMPNLHRFLHTICIFDVQICQDGPFKSFDRWLDEAVQFTCSKVRIGQTRSQQMSL